MKTIGVRELKEQASEILRVVREGGQSYEITYHGKVVARLVPVTESKDSLSEQEFLKRWDRLSKSVSERWSSDVSAVDAVREQRRDL